MTKIKDLTGQRFERLVVVKYTRSNKSGNAVWLCRCDCGVENKVSGNNLVKGSTTSCGCGRAKDLTNQRFGRLVVVKRLDKKLDNGNVAWLCQCDCGNIKEVTGSNLKRGNVTSCGCYRKELTRDRMSKPEGESNKNKVYKGYENGAKGRNLSFDLTLEQAEVFFQGSCHYCGSKPSNTSNDKGSNGAYVYSGIDRVDGSLGYMVNNCVSCCWKCNRAKMDMGYEEFKQWIKIAYIHLFT